jgi:serine/threonine-protein phosphatase 2A activator
MEPTKAPWATTQAPSGSNGALLPPIARGETTTAPWARTGPFTMPQRPIHVNILTTPHFPTPIEDLASHTFLPAQKRITNVQMLRKFLESPIAADFLGFTLALNDAVCGRALTDSCEISEATRALIKILDTMDTWVNGIPPAEHTLRYGNPSFRLWFAKLKEEAPTLVASVLPPSLNAQSDAIIELVPYLVDSFGNATRIDYGTGHETNFIAFLFCLARLGIITLQHDGVALVTKVFDRYVRLMRRIQTTYWLEPAGSHGVWGLDDYQFFPFIWGSAQLTDHAYLKPNVIHSQETLEQESQDFLYLAAVRFVKHVKKGPLSETSPILNDISVVPSWTKVNRGMIKMYQAEVLGKVPIMQHFLFGSLIKWPE